MEFSYFTRKLNKKLFEESTSKLLETIADNPDRYVWLFRSTKAKTKLIQNITQSHEIRFWDALEDIFEEYFELLWFELMDKVIRRDISSDWEEYNIDQLFRNTKTNVIYLIEQKVRDDHDSTKKRWQFDNFEKKYYEVSRQYPNHTIIPIMWFIDPSLVKNKKYYQEEMERLASDYWCSPQLCYWRELFDLNDDLPIEMWNEIISYLWEWKDSLPDMPELNLDLKCDEVFEEIKDIKPIIYRKLFNNDNIKEQILPILFPEWSVLRRLKDYFMTKNETIYYDLANYISEYIWNQMGKFWF